MNHPEPLDFASTWDAYTRYNNCERHTDAGEIAFWKQNAHSYDQRMRRDPHSYQQTLAVIREYVGREDTLLDVGAGTGRFALPLAEHMRSITALDQSPDMLAILAEQAQQNGNNNIHTLVGNWENTPVVPHNVVLAAWSLYRQRDILSSLQKLVDATKRTLLIINGDYAPRPDDDPPHELLKTAIWGPGDPGICNYLYFAGMLRQLYIRADVRVVYEQQTHIASDLNTLARDLASSNANKDEIATFAEQLKDYTEQTPDGCVYRCRFAVGIVTWQRPTDGV